MLVMFNLHMFPLKPQTVGFEGRITAPRVDAICPAPSKQESMASFCPGVWAYSKSCAQPRGHQHDIYIDIRTTTTCNHLLSRHKMYTNGCSSQVYCLVSWLQAIALCWCQGLRTCSGSRCDVVLRVLIICWLWF